MTTTRSLVESSLSPQETAQRLLKLREEEMTAKQSEVFQSLADQIRLEIQKQFDCKAILFNRNVEDGQHIDYLSNIVSDHNNGQVRIKTELVCDGAEGIVLIKAMTVSVNMEDSPVTLPSGLTFPIAQSSFQPIWKVLSSTYQEQLDSLQ